MVVTTGAIRRAQLQSNHHHQQTNIQHFTGRMPFLSPNQQCQSTEGKISHSTDLLTQSSSGGLWTFSLTTKGSWSELLLLLARLGINVLEKMTRRVIGFIMIHLGKEESQWGVGIIIIDRITTNCVERSGVRVTRCSIHPSIHVFISN